jgi:hypothetical protein
MTATLVSHNQVPDIRRSVTHHAVHDHGGLKVSPRGLTDAKQQTSWSMAAMIIVADPPIVRVVISRPSLVRL